MDRQARSAADSGDPVLERQVRSQLMPREAVPVVALLPYQTTCPQIFRVGVKGPVAILQGSPIGILAHRQAVDAGLGEVDAGTVPGLVGTIAETLVEEGIVGIGRCGSDLLRLDGLGRLSEHEGQPETLPAIYAVEHGRDHAEIQAIVRMAEILSLGVILRNEADAPAEAPCFTERMGYTAVEAVALQCLVAGRKLQHINRIIARIDKHGCHHILAVQLLEGETAGHKGLSETAPGLGGRTGPPEIGRRIAGTETALLDAGIDLGRGGVAAGGARLEADVPALGTKQPESATHQHQYAEKPFRFHRNPCLNCWYPGG